MNDQALLNYLQSQQMGQDSQIQQTQSSIPQAQPPYNPFDTGISKAINSARQSLGMTDKQQDKALRRSMLTFGNAISQQPKQRGFFNNLGSIAQSLSPAIMAHDEAEDSALKENNALANQILQYNAAEQARKAQEQERAWHHKFAEAQLDESRRSHNLLDNFRRGKANQQNEGLSLGGDYIPITSKNERLLYVKDKKASGEILKELSDIDKNYREFKDLSANDLIDPMTPYGIGKATNSAADFFGFFSGNKKLKEQTAKRKALEAKLGKFNVELERKLKGGVLSEAMVKRFEDKSLLPSLNDAPNIFEEKLSNLTKEMAERYEASDASLKSGLHISSYDLAKLKGEEERSAELESEPNIDTNNQDMIQMLDPETGEQDLIPANRIDEALQDGLVPVNE